MKTRTYYHVIESFRGLVGWHGCYDTLQEAEQEAKRLSDFFPNCEFYVDVLPTSKEPNYINC
jgi:hypothetical protein